MVKKIKLTARRLSNNGGGAILVEHALLNGIIVALTIATAIAIGTWANGEFGVLRAALYI